MCGFSVTDDEKIEFHFGWTWSSIYVNNIEYGKNAEIKVNKNKVRDELNKFTKKQLISYMLELAINGDEG